MIKRKKMRSEARGQLRILQVRSLMMRSIVSAKKKCRTKRTKQKHY